MAVGTSNLPYDCGLWYSAKVFILKATSLHTSLRCPLTTSASLQRLQMGTEDSGDSNGAYVRLHHDEQELPFSLNMYSLKIQTANQSFLCLYRSGK